VTPYSINIVTQRQPIASQLNHYVRAVRRGAIGRGMGQDDSGDSYGDDGTVSPSVPSIGESTTPVFLDVPTGPDTYTAPFSSSDIATLQSQAAALSTGIGSSISTAYNAATAPSAGGGFNLATFISSLSGAAVAGAKVYNSTQPPSLIPGTSAIYNPATGQILGAGLTSADTTTLITYGGLALAAFLAITLFSNMGKH
jgi:hypothetical protein